MPKTKIVYFSQQNVRISCRYEKTGSQSRLFAIQNAPQTNASENR